MLSTLNRDNRCPQALQNINQTIPSHTRMLVNTDSPSSKALSIKQINITRKITTQSRMINLRQSRQLFLSTKYHSRSTDSRFILLSNFTISTVKLNPIAVKRNMRARHHNGRHSLILRIKSQRWCRQNATKINLTALFKNSLHTR